MIAPSVKTMLLSPMALEGLCQYRITLQEHQARYRAKRLRVLPRKWTQFPVQFEIPISAIGLIGLF